MRVSVLAVILSFGLSLNAWGTENLDEAQNDWHQALETVAIDIENSFFVFTHERAQPQVKDARAIQHFSSFRSDYLLNGEPSLSIAVITDTPSETQDPFKAITLKYFSKILSDTLNQNPKLRLINRAQIENILGEQEFQAGGLVDSNTAARLGKIQGVQYMVFISVEVGEVKSDFFVKVIDVETAEELAPFQGPGIWNLNNYLRDINSYRLLFSHFNKTPLTFTDTKPHKDTPSKELRQANTKEDPSLDFGAHLRGSADKKSFYDRAMTPFHGARGETEATRMTLWGMGPVNFRKDREVTEGTDLRFGFFSYNDGHREVEGLKSRFLIDSGADVQVQRVKVLRVENPHLIHFLSDRLFLGLNFQGYEYEDDKERQFKTNDWLSGGVASRFYPSQPHNVYLALNVNGSALRDVDFDALKAQDRTALQVQVATCVANSDETWVCEVGSRYETIDVKDTSEDLEHMNEFATLKYNLTRSKRSSGFPDLWIALEYERDKWQFRDDNLVDPQQLFSVYFLFEF